MSKVSAPFVRNPYNYDLKEASDSSGLDCSCDGAGRTKQSFAEESDINTLVRRFGIGNIPLPPGFRAPQYGDFTHNSDYQGSLNAVNEAQRSFMMLPADLRSRFGNDPGAFVGFCLDDDNRPEAIRLGLIPEPVVVAPLARAAVVVAPEVPVDKP